jgi:hypothetical protein
MVLTRSSMACIDLRKDSSICASIYEICAIDGCQQLMTD